jgi:endoglucanase
MTRSKRPSPKNAGGKLTRRAFIAGSVALTGTAAYLAASARHVDGTEAVARPLATPGILRRGGSIHTMMNWADLDPANPARYAWPPFAAQHFAVDPAMLRAFRQAGLDHIRMTVDPGPFLQATPEQLEQVNEILLRRCRELIAADFNVIIDFHPTQQIARFAPERIIADQTSEQFHAYTNMLASVARAVKASGESRIILEMMNEPPYGYDAGSAARWQKMQSIFLAAVRRENATLPVILTGACSGGILGLQYIDSAAFDDPNVYWSFHYYDPHTFTHQGVVTSQSNMLYYRYLAGIAWPAAETHIQPTRDLIAARIDTDRTPPDPDRAKLKEQAFAAVDTYVKADYSEKSIQNDFSTVAAWAAKNNVPADRIYLGEFGVMRDTSASSGARAHFREAWMRAVRTAAERRGFAWSLWDINDTSMGLVEEKNKVALHEGTVHALGLTLPGIDKFQAKRPNG